MIAATSHEVVCPFCALLCDDLVIESEGSRLRVMANGCPRAVAGFARDVSVLATPLLDAKPATLDAAIARAGQILRGSRLPLLAGLGTDTAGMRAAIARIATVTFASSSRSSRVRPKPASNLSRSIQQVFEL